MAPQTTHFRDDFYKGDKPTDLIFQCDAHFPSTFPPVLRLTKTNDQGVPQEWSTGRVLYSKPVPFGNSADFTSTVKFIINGTSPMADGLAFFIVPNGHHFPPPTGGNLGLFGPRKAPHVFAVALDTYSDNPGYVNLGIDIESRTPSANVQVPISFVVGEEHQGKELTLNVSYFSATNAISASLTDGSQTLSVPLTHDLSQILGPTVQVGLASSTGDHVAVHDVYTWEFNSTIRREFNSTIQ